MELDDTSRVDTYDKINIGRPDVEGSATDTEQYEIPDVPSQNRYGEHAYNIYNLHMFTLFCSEK